MAQLPNTDKKIMTKAEYSRYRGCTSATINNYVKSGKIPKNALVMDGKREKIVIEIADNALDNNIYSDSNIRLPDTTGLNLNGDEIEKLKLRFLIEQTEEKRIKNEINLLKLEVEREKYILKSDVEKEVFEISRAVRDNVMALSDKLPGKLATISDVFKIKRVLEKETRSVIDDIMKDEIIIECPFCGKEIE